MLAPVAPLLIQLPVNDTMEVAENGSSDTTPYMQVKEKKKAAGPCFRLGQLWTYSHLGSKLADERSLLLPSFCNSSFQANEMIFFSI